MDIYDRKSHIYIIHSVIWLIFSFIGSFGEGGKMNNPMWIRFAGEVIYILYSYLFGLYFISLTEFTRHKK